ncbi:hypothetical protein [Candidatus Nanopusillus massiliensis]|uniref:hypothetical protein n=1 Tax=Candidatus Nanopusillus massiliensis TaxID=2897163 RepID=UPI001E2E4CD8|nr:hypothetical protein [Candidatus Nanopusillus massiliensis]
MKNMQIVFTADYNKNVKILEVVAEVPSKRLRNMLAGYYNKTKLKNYKAHDGRANNNIYRK